MGKKNREKKKSPFYCLGCNKPYMEKQTDIGSQYLEDYVRYLGFCHIDCFEKLPHHERHEHAELAILNGSVSKVKHKFYLKNIPNYI